MILSAPKSGSEEALGRVFNALAAAYDFKQQGDEVTVRFQGTGTRWIGELTKAEHPAHELFEAVKDQVAGVSCGCADVFGANEEVEKSGFENAQQPFTTHPNGEFLLANHPVETFGCTAWS